jgi:hypothetical protein
VLCGWLLDCHWLFVGCSLDSRKVPLIAPSGNAEYIEHAMEKKREEVSREEKRRGK